jgi:mannosyltransferase
MSIETDAPGFDGSLLDPPFPQRERIIPAERRRPPRPSGAPPRRRRRSYGAEIIAPCILAAVLCLIELGTRSLWLDEGATVAIVSAHGAALWRAIAHDGGNMLVYYLFMHVVIGLFGDGAALIRIPSVVATVATVGVTGLIGRRLFDRRVAFAAAMFTAVSLPLIFWGQDARGYAPLVTFCAGSFLAFVMVLDSDGQPPIWLLVAYVLSTVLAVYMGFVGVLVVPAQLLVLVFHRRDLWRRMLGASAVIGLACVPLLALASARGSSQLFWVPAPNRQVIGQTARWLTSSGMPPNFHPTSTGTLTFVLTVLVLAVGLGLSLRMIVRAARRRRFEREAWATLMVLSWFFVPIVLSLAESAEGQPILLFRNAVICLPAVALALAWVLVRAPWGRLEGRTTVRGIRLRTLLGWTVVAGILLLRALQLAPSYGVSPENWKAAEHYVSGHVRPGDCIAFYPLDGRMAFDYYVRGGENSSGLLATIDELVHAPTPVDPATPWNENPPFVEDYSLPSNARLQQIEQQCSRLWFVSSHEGQAGGPPGSRFNYAQYRVLGATLQLTYTTHHKRTFGWASPVQVELLSGRHLAHAG